MSTPIQAKFIALDKLIKDDSEWTCDYVDRNEQKLNVYKEFGNGIRYFEYMIPCNSLQDMYPDKYSGWIFDVRTGKISRCKTDQKYKKTPSELSATVDDRDVLVCHAECFSGTYKTTAVSLDVVVYIRSLQCDMEGGYTLSHMYYDNDTGHRSANCFTYSGTVPKFAQQSMSCGSVSKIYDESDSSRDSLKRYNLWRFGGIKVSKKNSKGEWIAMHNNHLDATVCTANFWRMYWDETEDGRIISRPQWQQCRIVTADSDDLMICRTGASMILSCGQFVVVGGIMADKYIGNNKCQPMLLTPTRASVNCTDDNLKYEASSFVMANQVGNVALESFDRMKIGAVSDKIVFAAFNSKHSKNSNMSEIFSLFIYDVSEDTFDQIELINDIKELRPNARSRVYDTTVSICMRGSCPVFSVSHYASNTITHNRSATYLLAMSNQISTDWRPATHSTFGATFRLIVFEILLMHWHDQYDESELFGFEWNMLPWEIIERIIVWLGRFDIDSRKSSASKKGKRSNNDHLDSSSNY